MSIESLVQGRILILKINSDLDESVSATLEGILNPLLSQHSGIGHIVLDLGANQISHASFRHLSPLALSLRKDKKQIYVLSSQRSVHRLIKSEGMDRSLKPINDVAEIHVEEVRTTKPEGPKLDVNFVNPLIEGTLHVLKVQAQMEVTPGKPKLKDLENPPPNIDIAGIIGVTSSGFNGGIALCFPEKVFLSIMSSMLGEDYK
ncbi:MAG: hypothetical protein RBT63_03415 [Bdellovibrionales bacterium]|jgi:chemotaxis protein CheX|nr:hypothetical protein [Bdellovibrionales bacterium]